MNITVTASGFKLTQAIREHAEGRLAPVLEKHLHNEATKIAVHLKDQSGPHGAQEYSCEIVAEFPKKHRVHVEERGDDLYKTMDVTANRLDRAVKRVKEKSRQVNLRKERKTKRSAKDL